MGNTRKPPPAPYLTSENSRLLPRFSEIRASGTERFVATPMAGERNGKGYLPPGTLAAWGHGIALVARYLTR